MAGAADPIPEPRLGPYRGPVVVLALAAVVVLGALLISLVGAVRAPDDVSNSATVLGTFPIDPDAEGIPAGPAGAQTDPGASTTAPEGIGTVPPTGPTSVPGPTTTPTPSSDPPDAEAALFDEDLAAWEQVDGDWLVTDGALVVPAASDEAPSFLLRTDAAATGVGGQVESPARAAGLVVGYADPGTYVAALAVPALGGWRLEVVVDGEQVDSASVPASTTAGTTVGFARRDGEAVLFVDGAEVGSVALPDGLGERTGFVARGPAGARWVAAVEG